MVKKEEIVALNGRLRLLKKQTDHYHEKAIAAGGKGRANTLKSLVLDYENLQDVYNPIVEERGLLDITKMDDVDAEFEEINKGSFNRRCEKIKRNLESAIGVLETIKEKDIGTSKLAEAQTLRGRLEELEEYPQITKNLMLAIEAFEEGHSKASAQLVGTVVDYVSDELKSELNVGGWREAYEELEERNIIDPATQGNINRALKASRDDIAHEVDRYPDEEECLLLLSGAVQLVYSIREIEEVDL